MAEHTILQLVCGNHGAMDYERLLDISYGLPGISAQDSLDHILRESGAFRVIQGRDGKQVLVHAPVRLCRKSGCALPCDHLHLCKYELMTGRCGRHGCEFGHQQLQSVHNERILRAHHMTRLSREELRVILLQSDSGLLPPVCAAFNQGRGPYGNCPDGEQCNRLHVCESFIRGRCDLTDCVRPHGFHEPTLRRVLFSRGVTPPLMDSLPFIYRNILALRDHRNMRLLPARRITDAESEICLSFLRGFCRNDECSRTHCKMPYKWEVKVGQTWHNLPNSEQIERDYCDPSKMHSFGNEPVCFEEMTLGLDEVRRLSTKSSVLLPGLVFTTSWTWYWKDEYNSWIQYASVAEMHRLSSVSSEQLEEEYQKYLQQNQEDAGIKFRAGNRFYELCFADMKQRNEVSGTERPVRRRPVFVSSIDVQNTRARCCGASKAHFYKGVPRFWDHSAIPDSGFQRVRLPPCHRDYVRVQERFNETMRGFTVRQIERVQNRELWEDFMTKKEQMKMANNERYGERILFHGTSSSFLDGVCLRNFGFQEFDAAAYGKGIYFSKDARHWDKQTGSPVRWMFACRVLVGHYTRGDARFCHPPAKNAGSLYDSCVDNPRDPNVFVVFDRSQIYPEFLITYEENNKLEEVRLGIGACDVSLATGIAQVHVKDPSQNSKATEPEWTSVIFNSACVRTTATASSARSLKGPDSDLQHTSPILHPLSLSSTLHTTVGAPTALPVSGERAPTALPVLGERAPTALLVSGERAPTALLVSGERAPTALPASGERAPTALPASGERAPTALPASAERAPTALPVSAERAPTALPVSADRAPTALPVSADRAPTALPVSAERASTALPVSAESSLFRHCGTIGEDLELVSMESQSLAVPSLPVSGSDHLLSSSRSVSSSSTPSSQHQRDHSAGPNPHKPAERKCVVM